MKKIKTSHSKKRGIEFSMPKVPTYVAKYLFCDISNEGVEVGALNSFKFQ